VLVAGTSTCYSATDNDYVNTSSPRLFYGVEVARRRSGINYLYIHRNIRDMIKDRVQLSTEEGISETRLYLTCNNVYFDLLNVAVGQNSVRDSFVRSECNCTGGPELWLTSLYILHDFLTR
jgi:hypothetical protein